MFSNLNKPTFGSAQQTSSFGFGATANQNPFGQSQLFGKPGTSTFGSTTPSFGQPNSGTQLFQTTQQQQQPNLFQSSSAPSFGTASQPGGFGSNLFGNAAAQAGTSGLFGTNTFGQQNKTPSFGFGASTSQSSGLFGQSQPPVQNTSMFQPPVSSSVFGNSFAQPMQSGTVVKFVPVTGTDTMQKAGIASTINTKHHCITCMKEYEGKSLEELRWEDYQSGRKGPQQQSGFGVTPFGATAPQSQPIFGQPENKTVFGQPGFGQNTSGFSVQNQQNLNLFQKPNTGFGTPAKDNNTFGFNAVGSNPFGTTNTATKPFGTLQAQPLFGTSAPQQNTAFGGSLFGQTSTQNNTSLFGKPAQQATGFNTGQAGYTFGQPTSTQSTGLFQQKPITGFTLFNQSNTTTPAFGQQTGFGPNQNAFGGNAFGKPTMTFGQPTQSSFGSGLGLQQNGSIFGNNSKPNGLFSNNNTTGGMFSSNALQNNLGFNMQSQQQTQLLDSQTFDASSLVQIADPFGHEDHLHGLTPIKDKHIFRSTNPSEIKALLQSSDKKTSVTMRNTERLKVLPYNDKKLALFDDIVDKSVIEANCELKRSAKRLVLRKMETTNNHNSNSNLILDFDTEHDSLLKAKIASDLVNGYSRTSAEASTNTNKPNIFYNANNDPEFLKFEKHTNDNQVKSIDLNANNKCQSVSVEDKSVEDKELDEICNMSSPTQKSSFQTSYINNTCGVKLQRPEYYTVPPLQDLNKYVNEEGKCIVKGFTIGRIGYGNVYFPDEIDVTNLDLDELVHFRHREIIVYPDDLKKPPVGQELNRRAQVTLDNIYPHDKKQNIVSDVDYLIKINFSERLRKVSERHDSVFKEYRPETGSWVFDVDHFSLYGIKKEDEKALEVQCNDDSAENDDQQTGISQDRSELLGKRNYSVSSSARLRRLTNEIDSDEINIDTDESTVNRLGDLPENGIISIGKSYIQFPFTKRYHRVLQTDIPMMKTSLFEDETVSEISEADVDYWQQFNEFDKETVTEDSVVYEDKCSDDEGECFVTLPIDKCSLNLNGIADLAKFNSFKVGWDVGLKLVGVKNDIISGGVGSLSFLHVPMILQVECTNNFLQDPFMNMIPDILKMVLSESTIKTDRDGVPTIQIDAGVGADMLLQCRNLMRRMSLKTPENKYLNYYIDIFDLCDIFWGVGLPTDSFRRRAFSKWLEIAVENDVEFEFDSLNKLSETNAADKIFVLLTGHKIQKATELANRSDLYYLSLLLSQLSSSKVNKELVQKQIEQWEDNMSIKHVDNIILKLYMLISGQLSKSSVNVCEGLNWKRALALHLWYVSPQMAPLKHALQLYEEAFKSLKYAASPIPFYGKEDTEKDVYDIIYHIIKMYSFGEQSIIKILDPSTHTTDPNDFRLIWLLVQILVSLKVGVISEVHLDYIHTKFAAQLEKLGHWKWSIFILLFIKDAKLKECSVMNTLRNFVSCDPEELEIIEEDLIRDFNLPPAWINITKAHRARVVGNNVKEFEYLALANQYVECHNVALRYLLPYLMLSEQYESLKELLMPHILGLRDVPNWKIGGGLMLDFLQVQDMSIVHGFEHRNNSFYNMRYKLISVCQRIKQFPRETKEQIACIAIMSKNCSWYMKKISGIDNEIDFDMVDSENEYLFVSPDC